jgi:hypothetical protein
MTLIASPTPTHSLSINPRTARALPHRPPSCLPGRAGHGRAPSGRDPRGFDEGGALVERGGVIGRYLDPQGRPREVVARPGRAGSLMVLDRDAHTFGDRRLVAHLAADEPPTNASLICRHYLQDSSGRWCRPVTHEDLQMAEPEQGLSEGLPQTAADPAELIDGSGRSHRLELLTSGLSIPELRWLRHPSRGEVGEPRPVSLRDVVASLESYEPARAHTAAALARCGRDRKVSAAVLRAELRRLDASRIVLNRGLRQAVLRAVRTQGLSMSEIAIRCGRVKYDARGNASGETSWLARRVGISSESGESSPTPWVHSEVLALIARVGLGICPREVELG